MTTLEIIQFAAQIKVGSIIKHPYQTMIVTEVCKTIVKGYDKRWFDKSGKKQQIEMNFSTLLNPHYNKQLTIS